MSVFNAFVFIVVLLFSAFFSSTDAAGSEEWRRRSVYQLMTDRFARTNDSDNSPCNVLDFCGGTYQGLIHHLDWIQDMGFTAIWISPIAKGIDVTTQYGDNFHGYWTTDLLDVNQHFGSAADIKQLSDELHKRGMLLMFDIAINGMAVVGGANFNFSTIDYSHFVPFNKKDYFHPYCPIDFSNNTSDEVCWFGDNYVALADVNENNPFVHQFFLDWIPQLIQNYSVDGLRLDALKHMSAPFWGDFTNASRSFTMGEYYQEDPGQACPYQQVVSGFFNYPLYTPLYEGFSHPTASLAGIPGVTQSLITNHCSDPSILGTFVENHDLTRFWNQTSDVTLGKNAATYLVFAEGIPFVYAGFETMQAGAYPNYNRDPLWPAGWKETDMHTFLGTLNKLRNGVINKDGDNFLKGGMKFLYSAGNALVFKRGDIIVFTSNVGTNGANVQVVTQDTGLSKDTEMIDGLSNSTVTVGDGGVMTVIISHGMPMVFYPKTEYIKIVPSTKLIDTAQNISSPGTPGNSNSTQTNGTTTKSVATRLTGEQMNPWKLAFCGVTFIWGAWFIMFEY